MTDIATDIRSYLVTRASVTDLIGKRIYPDQLPQRAELPAAVYHVISSIPEHDVASGDATSSNTRIQIDCYATTSREARSVANAIRRAPLQGHSGKLGTDGTPIYQINCEEAFEFRSDSPTDGTDAWRYIVSQDYMISHKDT